MNVTRWLCLSENGQETEIHVKDSRPATLELVPIRPFLGVDNVRTNRAGMTGGDVRWVSERAVHVPPEPPKVGDAEWKRQQDEAAAKAEERTGSPCWSAFRLDHPEDWS